MCWRKQQHLLYKLTGKLPSCPGADPAVATWLLDPAANPQTLNRLLILFQLFIHFLEFDLEMSKTKVIQLKVIDMKKGIIYQKMLE